MTRSQAIYSPYARSILDLPVAQHPSNGRVSVTVTLNPQVHRTGTRVISSSAQSQSSSIPRSLRKRAGFTKTSEIKTREIDGVLVRYVESPSRCGHTCEINVVDVPEILGEIPRIRHSAHKSKNARNDAVAELERIVRERIQQTKKVPEPESLPTHTPSQSPEPEASPPVEPTSLQQTSSDEVDKQSQVTEAIPSAIIPEISAESATTVGSQEHTEGSRYDLRSNHTYQDLKNGANALIEEQKEHIVNSLASTVGDKKKHTSKGGATQRKQTQKKTFLPAREVTELLDDAKKIVGRVNKAAREVLDDSKAQIQQGKEHLDAAKQYKKLELFLNRKLGERSGKILILFRGKKKNLTISEARELRDIARSKVNFYKLSGKQIRFDGTVSAAIGHGIASGSKTLGKRIERLPSNVGDTFGANAGSALARMLMNNSMDFDTVKTEVGEAIVDTAKEVPLSIAKEVAYKTGKGIIKELAPAIAKKLPGLGTISTTYHVAKAISQAETAGQAGVLGAVALTDATINLGCITAAQMLIPIPFVGAAVGAAAGAALTSAFHDKLTTQK